MKKILSVLFVLAIVLFIHPSLIASADDGFAGGSGTEADPYIITNLAQLQYVTTDNLNESTTTYYRLDADITDPLTTTLCADGFSGHFDGNGHTITLAITSDDTPMWLPAPWGSGLFNENDGTISNLKVVGSVNGSMSGVGAVAGVNRGIITNCTSSATVNFIYNSEAKAMYTDQDSIGGLVGRNDGDKASISNCSSSGTVNVDTGASGIIPAIGAGGLIGYNFDHSTVSDSSASGTVNVGTNDDNDVYKGGLVGYINEGSITNCSASGDLPATNCPSNGDYQGGLIGAVTNDSAVITNCYSTGNVTGGKNGIIGGLIGSFKSKVPVTYCYSTGTVGLSSGANDDRWIGGLIGYMVSSKAEHCFSTGSTSMSGHTGKFGGLVGNQSGATMDDCYWNQTTSGLSSGSSSGIMGTGLTTSQMTGSAASTNMPGLGFDTNFTAKANTALKWYYPQLIALSSGSASAASLNSVTLSTPALSALSVSSGKFTPDFSSDTTDYTVTVGSSVSSIKLTPSTSLAGAGIEVNSNAVTSGGTSGDIDVTGSDITVPIKVNSTADGTYRTYNLTITKETASTVTSVTVKTEPTKVTYTAGDSLDLTGLVITLNKSDSTTEDVPFADFATKGITTTPANGAVLSTSDASVNITYTADNKSVSQSITVNPAPVTVTSVTIKTAPNKVTYTAGDALDLTGLVVTLNKSNSTTEDVAFADFATKGITTSIANGATLSESDNVVMITYTADNKSVSQSITVNPAPVTVTSVTIKTAPTKVTYTAGESLNLAGLVVTLNKSDSTTEDVAYANFASKGITTTPMNATSLSESNTSVNITYTANNKSVSQTITVNPAPVTVTSVTVKTAPTKVTYTAGESLNLAGLVVTLHKSDSTIEDVAFADFATKGITTTPMNATSLSESNTSVNITYTADNKSVSQTITVNPAPVTVTLVTVKTAPSKTTYTAGDLLDLTGLVVTLHKSDSTTEDVAFADFASKGITTSIANGATLSESDNAVMITYTADNKSVSQSITVNPAPVTVTSVTIKTAPNKVTYTAGDALDLTGLVVTLNKSNSTTEDVAFADFATKGITTSIANGATLSTSDTTINITYTADNKSVSQNITVNPAPVTVTSVTIKTASNKITYTAGDALDLTGLVVTLNKSDSTKEDVAFADFATKGITTTPANGAVLSTSDITINITYTADNKSVSQNITVNPAPVTVTSVTIKTAPTKVTYTAGESLDLTGLVVTLNKSNSTTEDVPFADFASKGITTTPANGAALSTSDTSFVITCTADNKSVSQAITVSAAPIPVTVTSITIKTAPNKTTYTADDALDLTGLVVTLNKSNSTTEDVAFTNFASKGITTSPMNGTILSISDTSVNITYTTDNKSVSQAITVNTAPIPVTVTSVTIKTAPTKVTYTAGESLDLTGLVVTLNKSNSTTEDVPFADFASKGITTSPMNGTPLSTTNTSVNITYTADNKSVSQFITVNTVPAGNATISPTSINYDLKSPADVVTTITWNSASRVTDVVYGVTSLITPDAYTVTGSALTIKSSYLSTLGASKGSSLTFKVLFDNGSYATLTINVIDSSTPVGPTAHSITIQSSGNGMVSADTYSAVRNTQVTLTPIPNSGYRFLGWQVVDGGVTITDNKFIMPDNNVTVRAIFEPISIVQYQVAVNGSYAAASGAGSHYPGEIVTINAGSPNGYTFIGWTSADGIIFANANSPVTTFTMPAGNVNVTASWNYNGSSGGHSHDKSDNGSGSGTVGDSNVIYAGNLGSSNTYTTSEITIQGTLTTVNGSNGYTAEIPADQIKSKAVSKAVVTVGESVVYLPAAVLSDAIGGGTGLTLTQSEIPASAMDSAKEAAEKTNGVALAVINFNLNRITTIGTEEIHNLSDEVTVTITLNEKQLAEIAAGKQAYIYYFDPATGTLSDMKAVFDMTSKTATFSTKHFSSYVLVVSGLPKPSVSGVVNNGVYGDNRKVIFENAMATLDGKVINSGDTVSVEGSHSLLITDNYGSTERINFTIDKSAPDIKMVNTKNIAVMNNGISDSNVTVTISDLSKVTKAVTRDGKDYTWPSQDIFTVDGKYVLTFKDELGKSIKQAFTIDKTAPVITVVTSKKGKKITVTEMNIVSKTVTLNGKKIAWSKSNIFTKKGFYVIMVTDQAKHKSKYQFKI